MVLMKIVVFVCILGQIYSKPNYNPGLPYQPATVNYPHPLPHPIIYNNVRHTIHPAVPRPNVYPSAPPYNPPICPQNRPNYQSQSPPFVQQVQQAYSPVVNQPPQYPPISHVHHRIHHTATVAHPPYPANQDPNTYQEVTPKCYQTTNVRICTKQTTAVSTPAPQVYETPPPKPPATTPPETPKTNYNTNVAPSYPAIPKNEIKPILKIVNTNSYTNGKRTHQVYTKTTQPPPVVYETTSTTTPYPPTMPYNTAVPSTYPSIPSYPLYPYSDTEKIKEKVHNPCRNPYCYNCPYDPYNMPYYDDYPQYPPPYFYNSNDQSDMAEYMKPKSVCLDKKKCKDMSCSDKKIKCKSVTIVDAPVKENTIVYEKPTQTTYPPMPTYAPPSQTTPPSIYNNGPYFPTAEQPKYPYDARTVNYIPMKLLKKQDANHSYPNKLKKVKIVKSSPRKITKIKTKKKDSSSSSSSSSSKSSSSCQRGKYGKIDSYTVRAELSKRHILGHPVINPYDFKPFTDIKQNNNKTNNSETMTSDAERAAEIKHGENVSQKVNNNKSQVEIMNSEGASESQEEKIVKTSENLAKKSN